MDGHERLLAEAVLGFAICIRLKSGPRIVQWKYNFVEKRSQHVVIAFGVGLLGRDHALVHRN